MSILAILTLYNSKIGDSKTAQSLLSVCKKEPQSFKDFKLIIYDNTRESQAILDFPLRYEYNHDPANGGLSSAYNYALKKATEGNYDWLLLLDDDTTLPFDFISKLKEISNNAQNDIAAIVPKAHYNGRHFSPYKVLFGGVHRPVDVKHIGVCDFEISAIGSAAMIRTSFVNETGGFSKTFWLDCLDSWIFHTIHSKGKKVYIAPVNIEHDLSVLDYDKFLAEDRFDNILKAEALFIRTYKTRAENYFYFARLLRRSLVLFLTVKNKKFAMITFKHFISLLWSSSEITLHEGKLAASK